MRMNVYAEELTTETEKVTKLAENTGITYTGVRIFLKSPDELHHTAEDDDRSAITFWGPKEKLREMLHNMLHVLS